jgi:hypothetical protein
MGLNALPILLRCNLAPVNPVRGEACHLQSTFLVQVRACLGTRPKDKAARLDQHHLFRWQSRRFGLRVPSGSAHEYHDESNLCGSAHTVEPYTDLPTGARPPHDLLACETYHLRSNDARWWRAGLASGSAISRGWRARVEAGAHSPRGSAPRSRRKPCMPRRPPNRRPATRSHFSLEIRQRLFCDGGGLGFVWPERGSR